MKQARSSFVFVEAECVTQSGFQCLILVFSGWLTNEIQHSCCCLLVERSKNIIILILRSHLEQFDSSVLEPFRGTVLARVLTKHASERSSTGAGGVSQATPIS